MPKTKTADVLTDVAASLKTLTDAVKGIEERLVKLEHPTDVKKEEPTPKVESVSVENPDHRKLVNEVLNKHFSFKTQSEFSGLRLVILVPKKYSNASDAHWSMYGADERPSKPFASHEVEPMFRVHLESVFNNFNPDIKALIVNDR